MSDYEENGVARDGFHSEDGGGRGGEIDDHRDSEAKVCANLRIVRAFSFCSYYCVSVRNWIWVRDLCEIRLVFELDM